MAEIEREIDDALACPPWVLAYLTGAATRVLASVMALVVCAALAAPAFGQSRWLSGQQITEAFKGKTLEGYYNDHTPWVETYLASGRVAYSDNRNKWGGRWFLRGRVLCTFYDDNVNGGCFLVGRVSENCFDFYVVPRETKNGATAKPINPSYWNARGWATDRKSTCEMGGTS